MAISRSVAGVAVCLIAALTLISGVGPASADSSPREGHEELVAQIQRVAPAARVAVPNVVTESSAETDANGVRTTVPLAPGGSVTVSAVIDGTGAPGTIWRVAC